MAVQKYKVGGSQLREKAAAERDAKIKDVISRATKAVEHSKELIQTSTKLVRSTGGKRRRPN